MMSPRRDVTSPIGDRGGGFAPVRLVVFLPVVAMASRPALIWRGTKCFFFL